MARHRLVIDHVTTDANNALLHDLAPPPPAPDRVGTPQPRRHTGRDRGPAQRLEQRPSAGTGALGVAGLLHDRGKVCIPRDILIKPGKLSVAEPDVVRDNPVLGARMLLASPDPMHLAAIVAYEHHIMRDGGGYPLSTMPEAPNTPAAWSISATSTMRCGPIGRYRQAWESERAIAYIEGRAGVAFDPAIA